MNKTMIIKNITFLGTSFIPLIILLAVIAGALLVVNMRINRSMRSPAEKEGMKKGLLAAFFTNSWLLGWLYTKRNADYNYDERKLK